MSRFAKLAARNTDTFGCTRRALDDAIDLIMLRVADENGIDLSEATAISPELMAVNALMRISVEKLADELVLNGISANRLSFEKRVPKVKKTAVPPTVTRAESEENAS